MAKSTLTVPIETTREFRVLFELCRLSGNRPENAVEIALLSKTADLDSQHFDYSIESLLTAKLAEFDKHVGNLRVTRYGISEIFTAKACPNSRTNYFPSINSMNIRLSRGHHLFDEVEPLWPDELSAPEKTASTTQTSKYLPDNTRARAMRKGVRRDLKKDDITAADLTSTGTRAVIITEMIAELEDLLTQFATAATIEISHSDKGCFAHQAGENDRIGRNEQISNISHSRKELNVANTPTDKKSQKPAKQTTRLQKPHPTPAPGTYPSLLFNSSPMAMETARTRADTNEKNTKDVQQNSAEVDITAWIRRSPQVKRKQHASNQNGKTRSADSTANVHASAGLAFDQLCNLINTKYLQPSLNCDKQVPTQVPTQLRKQLGQQHRQLLKELEAVNQTLFTFA